MQTVCCGVKCAEDMGALGERLGLRSDYICLGEGISEKLYDS